MFFNVSVRAAALLLGVMSASAAFASQVPIIAVSGERLLGVAKWPPDADALKTINEGKLDFFCAKQLPTHGAPVTGLADFGSPPSASDCKPLRVPDTGAGRVWKVAHVSVAQGTCPQGATLKVNFEEKRRQSAIGLGARAVLGLLRERVSKTLGVDAAAAPGQAVWCVQDHEYVQALDRSTIQVSANHAGAADDSTAAKMQFISGPTEHWFLSGDALVRGANEVKWNSASRTLVPQDKPQQLYLAINYLKGDVYSKYAPVSWDRVVGKLLLQPSKRPFDNVGVGIGYRFADGGSLLETVKTEDHTGAVLFVGHFWTRSDQVDAAGAVSKGRYEKSWRLGVSYSLGSLLQWLE
jgi:hypothetical protein